MNSLSIRSKLFIAIFLACAIVVTSGALLFHFRTQAAFDSHLQNLDRIYIENFASDLERYYANWQSWDALRSRQNWRELLRDSNRQIRQQMPRSQAPNAMKLSPRAAPLRGRGYFFRTSLYDSEKRWIQGNAGKLPITLQPLYFQEQLIGHLGLHARLPRTEGDIDDNFAQELNRTMLMVTLLTLFSSFIVALILSRQLVKPIRSLRTSTSELARGNYASRIEVNNNDELGLLSHDFNQLAQSLQQHEQSRRQWIMDIAHELRTPLSILRGEIEAIQDGISQADETTIQSLHQEILHLQRLVEDLYTLSMSDSGSLSYHKTEIDLAALLQETLNQFDHQLSAHPLKVSHSDLQHPIPLLADRQRIQQLLQNLFKNSLRYTHAPGILTIQLDTDQHQITLRFSDSAPGVPDEALPKLFDRLYRVDHSRNRATGGAGIGLSICHNIVQAHGGSMAASHSPHGGLTITVTLPKTR